MAITRSIRAISSSQRPQTLTKTAETNQEVAEGRYKAGVGTIIDLLKRLRRLRRSRGQARISAELNWEVARAQLALALGRLSGIEPLNTSAALP